MFEIIGAKAAGNHRPGFWKALSAAGIASLLIAALGAHPARAAGTCYVNASASGAKDGTTWINAYINLQFALTNALCTSVWVAKGVYYPTTTTDQTATFNVTPGVQVYGGFAGGELSTGQRNLAANVTILSGDIDLNDTGAGNIDQTSANIVGNNSYHVVTMDGTTTGITSSTVLDGFTITGGHATGVFPDDSGAGLRCNGDGSGHSCNPTLQNLTFIGNAANNKGGGLYDIGTNRGNSSPILTNVVFAGNAAASWGGGGGMYNDAEGGVAPSSSDGGVSSPTLTNVTFTGNQDHAMVNDGSGPFIGAGAVSSPVLTDVTFSGNAGTAMMNEVAGEPSTNASSPTLNNVTFSGNTGTYGGAMENYVGGPNESESPTLYNVTFSGNSATYGGAIYNYAHLGGGVTPVLFNVILWGDSATTMGSEIYNDTSTPDITTSVVEFSGGSGVSWDSLLGTDGGGNKDADPMLGPLQNNGGFTQTMALGSGSSALDDADWEVCPAADQRGVSRPRGVICDIGAYERIPANASLGSGYQTNVAVFRPSTGGWFVKNLLATTFGLSGDDPLPYDFNGDAISDVAVYRPSTSAWYVKNQFATIFGLPGDVPVPGDYDGNNTADVAVYRPSTSAWYVKNQFSTIFGLPGDIPVPGDYNGDGHTDVAVFRPSTGAWYVKGQFSAIFGLPGDIPVPGDYNGDGITDLAVFRPSTNAWYVRGQFSTIYGVAGDVPVPGDYDGNGTTDVAVFRPSTNGWFVRNQFSTIYGSSGDYPLPAPDTNADGNPYQ